MGGEGDHTLLVRVRSIAAIKPLKQSNKATLELDRLPFLCFSAFLALQCLFVFCLFFFLQSIFKEALFHLLCDPTVGKHFLGKFSPSEMEEELVAAANRWSDKRSEFVRGDRGCF